MADTFQFDEEERLITLLEAEDVGSSQYCCDLYCGSSTWSQRPTQIAMTQASSSRMQRRQTHGPDRRSFSPPAIHRGEGSQEADFQGGVAGGSAGSRGPGEGSRRGAKEHAYVRRIPNCSPWLHAWYGEPERQSMAKWLGGFFGDRQSNKPSTTVTVPTFQPCSARMPVVRLTLGFQLVASKMDAFEGGYSITTKLHSFQMGYGGPETPVKCDYRFGLENVMSIEVQHKESGCCCCCSGFRFNFASADLTGHALDICLQMKTSGKLQYTKTFGITVHSLNSSAAAKQTSTTTTSQNQHPATDPIEFEVKLSLGFKTAWDVQVLRKFLQVLQERPKFASFFEQASLAEDAESAARSLEKHFVPPDNSDTLRLCMERWVFPEQFRELMGRAIAKAKNVSSHQVGEALHLHLYELGMKGSPLGCLAALSAGALVPNGDHLGAPLVLGHWIQLLRDLCSIEPGKSVAAEALIPALVDRAVEVPDILTRLECLCVCGLAKDQLAGIEVLAVARMQESISLEDLPEAIGGMQVGPLAVVVSGFGESANNNLNNHAPSSGFASLMSTRSAHVDSWTVALAQKVLVGCKDHVENLEKKDVSIALLWYSSVFWDTVGNMLQSAHLDLTDFNLTMTAFITLAIQHFRATDLSAEDGFVQRAVQRASAMLGTSKADTLDQLEWFRKVDSLLQLRSKYLPGAAAGDGTLWPTAVSSGSEDSADKADTNVRDFIELVCSWALLRKTRRALKSTLVRIVDSCTPQTTADSDECRLERARAYAASIPKLQEVIDTYRVLTDSPVDWDILAMAIGKIACEGGEKTKAMRSDAGDQENLMVREEMPKEVEQFFQTLVDRTFKRVYTRDRRGSKTPSGLKVLGVTRVANDANWAAYVARRDAIKGRLSWLSLRSSDWPMDVTHPPITQGLPEDIGLSQIPELDEAAREVWLWHGTSAAGAEGITTDDFNLDLCGSNAGTLYGRGIYLAESCTKSDEYAAPDRRGVRHLLLCRASLGRVRYLDRDGFRPDELVQSCSGYWAQWDSILGDREKLRGTFREFVLYDTDQVYPNYIVKYQRIYT